MCSVAFKSHFHGIVVLIVHIVYEENNLFTLELFDFYLIFALQWCMSKSLVPISFDIHVVIRIEPCQ